MEIFPDKKIYVDHSKDFDVIPVSRKMEADFETPISLFVKTAGRSLLESVESGGNVGRYSFITKGKNLEIILKGRDYKIVRYLNNGEETGIEIGSMDNPLEKVKNIMDDIRMPDYEGLPPFSGGFIGYLGYEAVKYFEDVPTHEKGLEDIPDGIFISPEIIIAHDILKKNVTITVTTFPGDDPEKAYEDAVKNIENIVDSIKQPMGCLEYETNEEIYVSEDKTDLPLEDYSRIVGDCKEKIIGGEMIQAVLSREIRVRTNANPFDLYRTLRKVNPSPYLFFLDLDEFYITGSSPEVMVRVHEDELLLKPIAGTRSRGKNVSEDDRAASELLSNSKERAEHLMLVDLGRNDLGKVSKPGSVKVTDHMSIERYSHVMHLVSTIKGTLKEGFDAFDVIKACFPAGTVTGAPKIKAMEYIHRYEVGRRGPYGGMIFNLGFNGNLDSCITIRTMVIKDGQAFVRTGAGIVADSDEIMEYEETEHKARALIAAIERTGVRR